MLNARSQQQATTRLKNLAGAMLMWSGRGKSATLDNAVDLKQQRSGEYFLHESSLTFICMRILSWLRSAEERSRAKRITVGDPNSGELCGLLRRDL
jgi:hypothetical protein